MQIVPSLLFLAMAGLASAAPAAGPKVHRFASGEISRFASAYWFRTERGSVLVDAPFLSAEAGALRAEMAAAGALPLGAAILTDGQAARSWGLALLLTPGTRVWSSRSTAAALEGAFPRERERLLRAGVPFFSMPRTPPRVTNSFTGSLNLGFEGYTLRLLETGKSGEPPVTVVFVPETAELFAGGLVWNRVHPVTGGADLGAWRRALERLERLGPRKVYPGHGDAGTAELLDQMSGYLGRLQEAVRPYASRSALSARDIASLRRGLRRNHADWLLPDALEASLRSEHTRLRRLLARGE
jgi:glyoxylase-like metal-dependent hydrolase (beta-lactamase superfamily II)